MIPKQIQVAWKEKLCGKELVKLQRVTLCEKLAEAEFSKTHSLNSKNTCLHQHSASFSPGRVDKLSCAPPYVLTTPQSGTWMNSPSASLEFLGQNIQNIMFQVDNGVSESRRASIYKWFAVISIYGIDENWVKLIHFGSHAKFLKFLTEMNLDLKVITKKTQKTKKTKTKNPTNYWEYWE